MTEEKGSFKKEKKRQKHPPNRFFLFQFKEADAGGAFVTLIGVGGGIEAELLFGGANDEGSRFSLAEV